MKTISEIEKQLVILDDKIMQEKAQLLAVKESEEFQTLAILAGQIAEQQKELLDAVPNSMPEYNELKLEALEIFKRDGLREFGSLQGKFKKENYVNAERVLSAFDGDIDNFVLLADFKQSKLKEKIKELKATKKPEDMQLAKELLGAIESKGETLTDILIK